MMQVNLFPRQDRNVDGEIGHVDMGVREGWGKLGDSVWYKYTTMCEIAGGSLLYSTRSSAPYSIVQQKLTQHCKAIIFQFFKSG